MKTKRDINNMIYQISNISTINSQRDIYNFTSLCIKSSTFTKSQVR